MQNIIAAILLFLSIVFLVFWFLQRFPSVRPFLAWLARLNTRLPLKGYHRFYHARLLFPGQEGALEFEEFLAIKELLAAGVFLVFAVPLGLPVAGCVLIALVFFFLPDIKFQERLRKRQEALRRSFVPFLDLLSLILESGADFMGGLNFLSSRFPAGDLAGEIGKVLLETRLGTTREKALLRFAERTGEKDIAEFVSIVIASEKSGGSLARALKTLSTTVKTTRIQRAEKAAHEAPVRLLGPLVVFIFPVVFIVLFGPIIISYLK